MKTRQTYSSDTSLCFEYVFTQFVAGVGRIFFSIPSLSVHYKHCASSPAIAMAEGKSSNYATLVNLSSCFAFP